MRRGLRKAANEPDELIDLWIGKVAAEGGHVPAAILNDAAEGGIVLPLDRDGAQIRDVEAGTDLGAFPILCVAGGAAREEGLAGILEGGVSRRRCSDRGVAGNCSGAKDNANAGNSRKGE
jgi:hypothetical protein